MKKKLLLTVIIVVAILCMFAVSVGAVTLAKDSTVTLNGEYKKNGASVTNPVVNLYDNDGDALIWYLDTGKNLVSDKAANLVNVDSEGIISFKTQSIFYNSTTREGVVVVNLRDNVKVSGTDINFDGQIEHFDPTKAESGKDNFNHGFQFGGYSFSVSKSNLQYFYFPITAKTIGARMFQRTSVIVADILPGTPISKIGAMGFYGAENLKEIFIPNDITTLYVSQDGGVFQECRALEKVIFEEKSTLVNAGYATFKDCNSLTELYLPNSVKTLGREFVRNAKKLETFSFGASFEYFTMFGTDADSAHMWVFYSCGSLKNVYMPATFALISDEYAYDDLVNQFIMNNETKVYIGDDRLDTFDRIFDNAGSFTFFFTGTEEDIGKIKDRLAYTVNNGSLTSALSNPNKIYSYDEYIAAGSPSGSCAVYGYNVCDAFYNSTHDIQTKGENKCCGICSNCGKKEMLENPEHTYTYVFNDNGVISLLAQITVKQVCSFCQDEIVEDSIPAIFENYGSSSSMTGVGVHQKTKVNEKALADYAKLTGNENVYNYGIFAGVAVDRDGTEYDGDLVAVNGTAVSAKNSEKSVVASFANTDYTILTIKITGVTAGDQIYFGTFATVGNNVTYVTGNTEGNKAEAQTIA